jgi:DNA-binding NarL/FixJ family response regulator
VTAAIAEIITKQPECVVLDWMLPDLNGVEILRVIRERRLPIKVAVYTAAHDPHSFPGLAELKPDAIFENGRDLTKLRAWLDQQNQPE